MYVLHSFGCLRNMKLYYYHSPTFVNKKILLVFHLYSTIRTDTRRFTIMKRKTATVLILFLITLSGISAAFLYRPKKSNQPVTSPTVTNTPTATPSPTPTVIPTPTLEPAPSPEPTPSPVTICLGGDLMCLGGQQRSAQTADGGFDFTNSFSIIKDHLTSCDFAIANLETMISGSYPLTKDYTYGETGSPHCNGPEEYLAAIKEAGFTALCGSNNHTVDCGTTGINETIQKLEQYGLLCTGMYQSASPSDTDTENEVGSAPEKNTPRYLILEKNGIKIGLVAFTELINLRDQFQKEDLEQVVNCYNKTFAEELISEAKEAGADYVIAYNHWGSENTHDVRSYQRVHAKELADAGADLIIGTHSHCLQGTDVILAADGREVPCYYSLGNLVSSMQREINNDTALITITLHYTENGVRLKDTQIMPCHVFSRLDGRPHVIVPVSYPLEKESQQAELTKAKERIAEVLNLSYDERAR